MKRFNEENMFNPILNVSAFRVKAPNEVIAAVMEKFGEADFYAQEFLMYCSENNIVAYNWCQDNFFLESGAMYELES